VRINSIAVATVPPISLFEVSDLADIVVLAGRNGVGKTRLIQTLINFFRGSLPPPEQDRMPSVQLVLEATSDDERTAWGKTTLDTRDGQDAARLRQTLQQARRRSRWRSGVVQFESNLTITQINPFQFSWDFTDPWDEMVGWDLSIQGLTQRFNDMIHSLFRKVRSHRETIARRAEEAQRRGDKTLTLDFEDPLVQFKSAFRQLLAPKELLDVDPQRQTLLYTAGDSAQTQLPITSLSSGEREVLNIVFDFLLRNPEDCIVIFDEPELHLHPELSYKLIQTLRTVGARNQFIFCTHSPDIITASLDQSVVFVAPPSPSRSNQAIPVAEQDDTNQALKLLGQSIGIIALGKKLVLIEGTNSSLDKQTYGSILRERFPDLVLVPAGGKGLISSFALLIKEVLDRSLWGVQFFMLCDRDAVPSTVSAHDLEEAARGRLRVLPRYHLENYFLDPAVLARVFDRLEPPESPLRDPAAIEAKLRDLAQDLISYATALTVSAHFRTAAGNVDITPRGVHEMSATEVADALRARAVEESCRVSVALEPNAVGELAQRIHNEVKASLEDGTDAWKVVVPGRSLLHRFSNHVGLQPGRLKQAYIAEALLGPTSPFQDIIDIFAAFSAAEQIG
jgi:energy-coupling factor transporter ATP-binding protein EcfA2